MNMSQNSYPVVSIILWVFFVNTFCSIFATKFIEKEIFVDISERIKELCSKNNMSFRALERELGFGNGYFGRLKGKMSSDRLQKVADYFDVPLSYFFEGGLVPSTPSSHWIPILGRVAAGIPLEMIEDIIDYEEIPDSYGDCFALQINGDSMAPDLPRGSVVVVHKQDDVESGEIAIVALNGSDAVCKRVVKDAEGVVLQSFNPDFPPRFVPMGDEVTILGKVIESRRKW